MAATNVARDDKQSEGRLVSVPVAASTIIPAGTMVSTNASGYAIQAADTASTVFLGFAAETVDNSDGGNGDKKVQVYVRGTFEVNHVASASQASVGTTVYVADNQTVGTSSLTNDIAVGKVVEFVNATKVRVLI